VVEATPEQAQDIAELEALRDERKEELARVEQQLQCFALRYKAKNATERAQHFDQRTSETLAENKHMRREIELLRNSDRVMVSLRDTLETQKKHQRIRNAHIRQKEATIHLIAKRCTEQRDERVKMLDELSRDCAALDELADEEVAVESVVVTRTPLRSMAYLMRQDGHDEEHVEATIRDMDALRAEDDVVTRQLREQLAELSQGIDSAAGDKTAAMSDIAVEWEDTKERMLAEMQRLTKLNAEFEHHVRRGTNIKSTSNLPDTMTPEERSVRDLMLQRGEEEARLEEARRRHGAVADRAERQPLGLDAMEETATREMEATQRLVEGLEHANRDWHAKYQELQQRYTGEAIALAEAGEDAARYRSPSHSPARDDVTPQRHPAPRAFTPASADRLFSAKTKSRRVAEEVSQMENEDRQRRAAAMSRRPNVGKMA
jgi:hypothetical protein